MLSSDRLSEYRIVWLMLVFDLPVMLKRERKAAAKFRKNLLSNGFVMMQFSVYMRHCPSAENAEVHIKRIKSFLPGDGKVSILQITDKQYANMLHFIAAGYNAPKPGPQQLEIF
jgi:CRISPR-associated protein Cas2